MSNEENERKGVRLGRRTFLGAVAGAAALAASRSTVRASSEDVEESEASSGLGPANRRRAAFDKRVGAARLSRNRPLVEHPTNGDEESLPNFIGNFSKGLLHFDNGEVDPASYASLLAALRSGRPDDFERIQLSLGPRLTDPQAGLAFDLEGADSHHLTMRPAPAFSSAEAAGEMAELYWLALARDVSFTDFDSSPLVERAAADLSRYSDFRGPKVDGRVTPATIFRGKTAGDLVGPWLSQFLLQDVKFGAITYPQIMKTVVPGLDYLTSYDAWLTAQRGPGAAVGVPTYDTTRRYIRNLRDLAQWVHVDVLYQAYLHACLILLRNGAPFDDNLPPAAWRNQIGFVEFASPHVTSLISEVATRALKTVWYQKWFVHRRLRPEEFGARVHNHRTGVASYPLHDEIVSSAAADEVFSKFGTYLLPEAFPEGCPGHPAYGAGHATVAGACVTILKAFFNEQFELVNPVVPNADGTALVPWDGPPLTVGNELNKVAANIAIGRNGAGVHWRTDYGESISLGEEVAICLLQEQKACFNMDVEWRLTRFDGTEITV